MTRVTGINMENSEDLELVRYRPGGEHKPHVDQYETESEMEGVDPLYGNRFSQGLIFLNKPFLGGNFVMPMLGVSVVPRVGDMVVWYNTDSTGHLTHRSFHGGCKVYAGHKVAGALVSLVLDQKWAQCLLWQGKT